MYRQGDVLVVPITSIPRGATEEMLEKDCIVLAHGEATGHAHVIRDHSARMFCTPGQPKTKAIRFLRLVRSVELIHEEHDTVTIPPGDYEVIRQREYAPGEVRHVAD